MGWVSSIGREIGRLVDTPVGAAVRADVESAAVGGAIGGALPAETSEERARNVLLLGGGSVAGRRLFPEQLQDVQPGGFAGQKAKTADLRQLERAQAMEGAGQQKRDIWNQTGWMRGNDGEWRFEISDEAAGLTVQDIPRVEWEFDLAEVFEHPELFAAYPELRATQVVFQDLGPLARNSEGEIVQGSEGAYDRFFRTILLNNRLTRAEARETILHEGQHAIQDIEGFATGGMPEAGREFYQTQEIEQAFTRLGDLKLRHDAAPDEVTRMQISKDMDTLKQQIREQSQIEAYLRLPGEVEARLVERRKDMTAAERRATFPTDQQDVDPMVGPSDMALAASDGAAMSRAAGAEDEPLTLTQARASGYEGTSRGESVEWVRSVEKGLDMSTEARMQRARDMGFGMPQRQNMLGDEGRSAGLSPDASSRRGSEINTSGLERNQPLEVFYHGTLEDFSEFGRSGSHSGTPAGMYAFSNKPVVAESYTSPLGLQSREGQKIDRLIRQKEMDFDDPDREANLAALRAQRETLARLEPQDANIIPVFLRTRNPLVIDAQGRRWTNVAEGKDINRVAKEARAAGYDALIVNNVIDMGRPGAEEIATTAIIFDPANIRSVHAAFDPDFKSSANLLASQKGGPLTRTDRAELQAAADKGLDVSPEARAQRAQEQGFTTEAFREVQTAATPEDTEAASILGGAWLSDNPAPTEFTQRMTVPTRIRLDNPMTINAASDAEGKIKTSRLKGMIPDAMLEGRKTMTAQEVASIARAMGHDGVAFEGVGTEGRKMWVVFDPEKIRSANSAFDPDDARFLPELALAAGAGTAIAAGLIANGEIATSGDEVPPEEAEIVPGIPENAAANAVARINTQSLLSGGEVEDLPPDDPLRQDWFRQAQEERAQRDRNYQRWLDSQGGNGG